MWEPFTESARQSIVQAQQDLDFDHKSWSRTVRVRIQVAVNSLGQWQAQGWSVGGLPAEPIG